MTTQHPFEDASEFAAPVAAPEESLVDDDGVLYEDQVEPQHGVLGFTLREVIILGLWLVAFVVSFFPLAGAGGSVWAQGISWILPIGLPTVAVFLLVLRRFSPDGIRRVGSLGIDQFASVAFSVAAIWWAQVLWSLVGAGIASGVAPAAWVPWVEFAAALGLVAATVFAPLIPGIRDDFHGRLETLAHRNANPVRPVVARPAAEPVEAEEIEAELEVDTAAEAEEAVAVAAVLDVELSDLHTTDELARLDLSEQVPLSAHASGGDAGAALAEDEQVPGYARRSRREAEVTVDEDLPDEIAVDVDATNPRFSAVVAQPFWALAPTERDVVDESGELVFRIGPNAWALVIEDRGGAFVVRHDDGRIGYLHDIDDITKG